MCFSAVHTICLLAIEFIISGNKTVCTTGDITAQTPVLAGGNFTSMMQITN